MNSFKRYYTIRMILTVVFGLLFGTFFLLMMPYASELFDILVIAIGLLTAVLNLPGLYFSICHIKRRGEWINLSLTLGAVVLGILLMLLQRDIILVLGIYSVCLPFVRIGLVEDRKHQFKREMPLILTGLSMIFIFVTQSELLAIRVITIAIYALTALYLIYGLLTLHFRFGKIE